MTSSLVGVPTVLEGSQTLISRMQVFGIPQCILNIVNLWICVLEGPEDDPIRVETCCP